MGVLRPVSRLLCFFRLKKHEVLHFKWISIRFKVGKRKFFLWSVKNDLWFFFTAVKSLFSRFSSYQLILRLSSNFRQIYWFKEPIISSHLLLWPWRNCYLSSDVLPQWHHASSMTLSFSESTISVSPYYLNFIESANSVIPRINSS